MNRKQKNSDGVTPLQVILSTSLLCLSAVLLAAGSFDGVPARASALAFNNGEPILLAKLNPVPRETDAGLRVLQARVDPAQQEADGSWDGVQQEEAWDGLAYRSDTQVFPEVACDQGGGMYIENFDGVTRPTLPSGWTATNATNPDGIFWVTSNSGLPTPVADSTPNAAYINDPSAISDKRLDSVQITIPSANAQLQFRNNYALEETFDGGVLELSIGGGAFTDIITAGGSFVLNGYNAAISTEFGNPIAGRMAWSGSSGGFISTIVNLPASANGQTVIFRWRMASDDSTSSDGWRIDSVKVFCNGGAATPTPTPTPTPVPPPPPVCTLTEGFNDITTLISAGWVRRNNSSPLGTTGWLQGNTAIFTSQSGAPNAYIAANFQNGSMLATISNWLLMPPLTLQNGGALVFWTRTVDVPRFPDRLQVRMSTNGNSSNVGSSATDVGDFTTLLLDINPTYTTSGYPNVWTQFTVPISGLGSSTTGRLAFRYFVENGGPDGANSDYIGIDTVNYNCNSGGATPTPTPMPRPTPTPTPTPRPTPASTPTPTPTPRPTPTPTPTPSSTPTPTPRATPTPTPRLTPTATPTPTLTPTPTPTPNPAATPTPTPRATPALTPTPTPRPTPTSTPTPTPAATPTPTPRPTPALTPTPTPRATPASTPTPTPIATPTPTPRPSPTLTPTPTPTPRPTPTPAPRPTPTPTPRPNPRATPTPTPAPSATPNPPPTTFCTLGQGFYGNAGGRYNNSDSCYNNLQTLDLIKALLGDPTFTACGAPNPNPTSLVVGEPGRSLTITLDKATCVITRLPAGGPPTSLPAGNATFDSSCNAGSIPLKNSRFDNVFLGQFITLSLNVRLDPNLGGLILSNQFCTVGSNPTDIRTVTISQTVLSALDCQYGVHQHTATELLDLANRALGGLSTCGASISNINDAVSAINGGFDGCRGLLSACP